MSESYPENLEEVRTARAGRLRHPILRFIIAFLIPTAFFLFSMVIFFIVFIFIDNFFAGEVPDWFFFLLLVILFFSVSLTIFELYYSVFPGKRFSLISQMRNLVLFQI